MVESIINQGLPDKQGQLVKLSRQAYSSKVKAAKGFLGQYQGKTHESGREFGARIFSTETTDFENCEITLYDVGTTARGSNPDYSDPTVDLSLSRQKGSGNNWDLAASVHTHPGSGSENFSGMSEEDGNMVRGGSLKMRAALGGDKEVADYMGVPMFLGTPTGKLKQYDPSTRSVTVEFEGLPYDNSLFKSGDGAPSLNSEGKARPQPVFRSAEYNKYE